jgi:DNA-binding MarR family transcriptional regulator
MTSDTKKIIQHWRDAVPDDRLAHLVRDVSRAFTRSLTMRLERHGVPFGYWTFLRVLWEADGLIQKELSERAGVMEPTTFIALKSMEANGYIVRKHLPPNKKNVYVYLSVKGRALKKKLVSLAVESNNVSVEGIAATDIKLTRQTLLAMIENLGRDEQILNESVKRKGAATTATRPAAFTKTALGEKATKAASSTSKGAKPKFPAAKKTQKTT